MKRGYVFDIMSIFTIVLAFAIVIGFGAYLMYFASDYLGDKIDDGYNSVMTVDEFNENIVAPFEALDFVIPLLVGLLCLASIIAGYTSQSPSTLIVLFLFFAIIAMVAVSYLNEITTDFWGFIQTNESRVVFPYTTFVLQNLPMILGITLVLTALFMHSKSQTVPYR